MTAIIYTHPVDYVMAAISARVMQAQGINVYLAAEEKDPLPVCDFATAVHTTFERNRNLNGRDFIVGNLEMMQALATSEYTLKVDSDTLVLDAARLLDGRTEVAVGVYVPQMSGMQGCCYAIRTEALPAMILRAKKLGRRDYHIEDRVTGELAKKVGKVHTPEHSSEGLYQTWRPGRPHITVEGCKANKAVVVFPPNKDFKRPQVIATMKKFI